MTSHWCMFSLPSSRVSNPNRGKISPITKRNFRFLFASSLWRKNGQNANTPPGIWLQNLSTECFFWVSSSYISRDNCLLRVHSIYQHILLPKSTSYLDKNVFTKRSVSIVMSDGVIRGPRYINMFYYSWWRHQMETFSALLAICVGNSPVTGEFPVQRPVTRSFDVFFDLRPNKRLSKQWWDWWFETPSRPLWRHCNVKSTSHRRATTKMAVYRSATSA